MICVGDKVTVEVKHQQHRLVGPPNEVRDVPHDVSDDDIEFYLSIGWVDEWTLRTSHNEFKHLPRIFYTEQQARDAAMLAVNAALSADAWLQFEWH